MQNNNLPQAPLILAWIQSSPSDCISVINIAGLAEQGYGPSPQFFQGSRAGLLPLFEEARCLTPEERKILMNAAMRAQYEAADAAKTSSKNSQDRTI